MHRQWVFVGEKTASVISIAASSMIFLFWCSTIRPVRLSIEEVCPQVDMQMISLLFGKNSAQRQLYIEGRLMADPMRTSTNWTTPVVDMQITLDSSGDREIDRISE